LRGDPERKWASVKAPLPVEIDLVPPLAPLFHSTEAVLFIFIII
jgi:hypothetical protein